MPGGRARAPAADLIAEAHRPGAHAQRQRVADDRPFEIALRLALEEIEQAAAEMARLAGDEEDGHLAGFARLDGDGAAGAGRVANDVERAAERDDGAVGERGRDG